MFTRAAETAVLLDPRSGEYFSLSDVGAAVWELCDGSRSVEGIARVLADEYDAAYETILVDVRELVAELAGEGLVVETS